MSKLGTLLPIFGKSLLAPVALAMAMTACGNQQPSFTENAQTKRLSSDDAVARQNGVMSGLPGETHRDEAAGSGISGSPVSAGPDGIMGTPDDVSSGPDGVFGTKDDVKAGPDATLGTADDIGTGPDGIIGTTDDVVVGVEGGAHPPGMEGGVTLPGHDPNAQGVGEGGLKFPDGGTGGTSAGGSTSGTTDGGTGTTAGGTTAGTTGSGTTDGGTTAGGTTTGGTTSTAGGTSGGGTTATAGGTTAGDTTAGTTTGGTTAGGTTSGGATAGGTTAGGTTAGGTTGSTPVQRTVNLMQPSAGKVDILWIVDTSNSMSEEQSYLATNFNAMITALNDAGHDFQTAITTTDICQDTMPAALEDRVCPADYGGSPATHLRGSFVGTAGRKVLKRGDADLVSKFNTYVSQGVDGSGFEHGLKAAQMAVAKSLSGENEPLVRSGAFLAVIVVSDEQDDGIGLSQTDAYNGHNFYSEGYTRFRFTEDDMITYLRGVKGNGKFSVSAITPTRLANGALCAAPHTAPAEEGTQYILAAQKSGGIAQSICDTNWNASLARIGLDLDSQISQVVLPSTPKVDTIVVKVNGVMTSAWTYNAGNNAVKFNAGHVPAEGAAIEVTYTEM